MPKKRTWSPPLSDAFDVFRLHCQAQRFSPTTVQFYQDRIPRFVTWLKDHGVETLDAINANHVRAYIVARQDAGNSPGYVHGIARAIKTWLTFCAREGWLEANPMQTVTLPKRPRDIKPSFSKSEIAALLREATDERDRAIVYMLLDTGLRAAELVALRGGDVDVRAGAIVVRSGKGAKRRTVYAGSKTLRALLRYYAVRGAPEPEDHIWVSEREPHPPLNYSGLARRLRIIGRAVGIEVTPHRFRRTFALQCLRNGMDIYALARIMGHEDIDVLRVYLALTDVDIEAAHRRHGVVDNL